MYRDHPVNDFAAVVDAVTQFIDVREPDEVAEGTLPGTVNIPLGALPSCHGRGRLDASQPLQDQTHPVAGTAVMRRVELLEDRAARGLDAPDAVADQPTRVRPGSAAHAGSGLVRLRSSRRRLMSCATRYLLNRFLLLGFTA